MTTPTYTVRYLWTTCLWALQNDETGEVLREFISREEATAPDILRSLVGIGAIIRVEDADGRMCGDGELRVGVGENEPAGPTAPNATGV
jgi:hypothetical protein